MKKTLFVDMVTGTALMLLAIFWFYEASKMARVELGIGSGGYPTVISVALFIAGLLLAARSIIKGLPKPEGKIDRKAALRVVIFVGVTVAYVQAMRFLGFLLLTPLYLFFACCFFQYRKKVVAAIASVCVTAVLYGVFRMIFYVGLPTFRLF